MVQARAVFINPLGDSAVSEEGRSNHINGCAAGYVQEPSKEPAFRAVIGGERAADNDKGLLRDVLGALLAPDNAQGDTVDNRRVVVVQQSKGGAVLCLQTDYKRFL